jgi:hypothetical protein
MRVHIGHAKEGDIISFQYNDSANPNVANLNRPKPLHSRQSTSSAPLLASARISRTVKYASTCQRLREVTSDAPWRVFPRCRFATLGLTVRIKRSTRKYVTWLCKEFCRKTQS